MRPSVRPRDLKSHLKKKITSPHLQNRPGLTDTKRPHLVVTPVFEISRIDTFIETESGLVVPGAGRWARPGLPLGVMRISEAR